MKAEVTSKNGTVKSTSGTAGFPPATFLKIALKNILVPVDFSESSRKAVRYATSFARQFSAQVLLLHVVEPVPPPAPDYIIGDGLADSIQTQRAARHLAKWLKAIDSLIPARGSVQTGNASWEIVRAAEENNIDLIVIGMRGRTKLARLLLGSTAERVVRHAPCPVMVIREREHDFLVKAERQSALQNSPGAPETDIQRSADDVGQSRTARI